MRIRETCTVVGVLATCLAMSPSVSAQQSWVIVPGQGWGPVAIGMTEAQALSYFGPPVKVEMAEIAGGSPGQEKTVFFRTALLGFEKTGDTYVLSLIRIRASSSITSEGIGIGASIHDVLKTYGDYYKYAESTPEHPKGANDCIGAEATSGWLFGAPDEVYLSVHYKDRGISFEFGPLVRGVPSVPRVESITVVRSRPCPPVP